MMNIIFFLLVMFFLVRRGGMCRTDGKTLHNQRSRIILHSEDQRSVCMELERSVCKAACPVYDAYRLGWGKTVLQSQSCRRGTCGDWQTVPVLPVYRHPV